MTTANDILKTARKEIGIKEKPAGSNNVKYNTAYYGRKVSGSNYSWCCVFVWWVFKKAGASKLFYDGKKVAYCPNLAAWGIKCKLTVSKTQGRAGDIVLFDWDKNGNSDHVGIIEKKNSDGSYTTIEGNTSITSNDNGGKVMRRKRYISNINYIIRPKYKKTPTYPTLKKGSKGAAVLTLKKKLKKKGYKGFIMNNKFGEGTLKAVKSFQRKNKLVVDGIVGEKTWGKINK